MRVNTLAAKLVAALGTLILSFAPPAARAALTASDEFEYPTGAAAGRNGGSGFTTGYDPFSAFGSTTAGTINAPGLTFPGLLTRGNRYTTDGNDNAGVRRMPANNGETPGELWIAFLTSAEPGGQPPYAGMSLVNGNDEELFLGKPFNASEYGIDQSGGLQTAGGAIVSTDTTLLVYRITFAAGPDTVSMFVNPAPGAASPGQPALDASRDNVPFDGVIFNSGNTPGFNFDELRIGATYADVTPVPEPAAGTLCGAIAWLVAARRRSAALNERILLE
jgi:hypothetical protein